MRSLVKPFETPIRLLPYGGYRFDSPKEPLLFQPIGYEQLQEVSIRLRMDILPMKDRLNMEETAGIHPYSHSNLEAVKATSFWNLDLRKELLGKVLCHNPIRSREEGKYHRKEPSFISVEIRCPMDSIQGGMSHDFFGSPKRRLALFVRIPELTQ